MQAGVVVNNIVDMINGRPCSQIYKPKVFLESAIKLTLGKAHKVIYSMDSDGSDVLIPERNGTTLDLGIKHAWGQFGADFRLAGGGLAASEGDEKTMTSKA